MKHKDTVDYPGGMTQLAEDIGNLKYDSLQLFLILLSQKIENDGNKDLERGRLKLSENLIEASRALAASSANIGKAWKICEPYMK